VYIFQVGIKPTTVHARAECDGAAVNFTELSLTVDVKYMFTCQLL